MAKTAPTSTEQKTDVVVILPVERALPMITSVH
jgi:hypothetical protein